MCVNDRYIFKAKANKTKKWVYGNYIANLFENEPKSWYHDEILSYRDIKFYEVDRSTICQYTGKCDNGGMLVYENDIVSTKDYGRATVIWDNYGWKLETQFGIQDIENVMEVLGNKYD